MSEAESMRVVREVTEAVMENGPLVLVDRFPEWFLQDFEWRPKLLASVDGRMFRGESGFREYWREFLETFTEIAFEDTQLDPIDETTILVTATVRGKGAGSGVPIDRAVAYLFEVRDGRIAKGRTFFSPAEAREFLARA